MTELSIDSCSCRVECPKCGSTCEGTNYGCELDPPDSLEFEIDCEKCSCTFDAVFEVKGVKLEVI